MNAWTLVYRGWDPDAQPLREALCTLGNGRFATRGAAEEADAGGPHYPGTYLAGGYDRLKTEIAGRVIENEDLVNWPNWLPLSFRPEGGDWLDLGKLDVLDYRQELDLRAGLLRRALRVRDARGRETSLRSRRLVHMGDPYLAAIEWTLVPENWSGRLTVRSALDGTVTNSGVARYRDLNGQHLESLGTGREGEDGIWLHVRTGQSRIEMAQAAVTRLFRDAEHVTADRSTEEREGYVAQKLSFDAERAEPVRLEKIVALYTSRDPAISEACYEARRAIARAPSFEALLGSHRHAWDELWHRCDIELEDASGAQRALRAHIFHLLCTVSPNTIDRDAGVPARGLHGEAYRGHIFWDELYIFPFLNLRIPELTRALLMYRYRRLGEARTAARAAGLDGALFPWQSGSDGREESQEVHLNPRSGRWVPDETHLQRHVNAAIAYNVWQYYQATRDIEFISHYGGELMLEIARLWSSLTTYDPERERYEIHGVVGPDEYHTRYPDAEEPGLDNNAYTNLMAVWVLRRALELLDALARDRREELLEKLGVDEEEIDRWRDVASRMFVPFHDDGIISQFEGYEALEEFDWEAYRDSYGDIQRLDRILEAEGDTPNRYKAAKQADVLMLFYLFSTEELQALFEGLDYAFEPELIPRNIEYYLERTSHGSTLSGVVHSWVLARSDRERSWRWFRQALESDLADIQGGTTHEGIHLGAMAGTVDLIQRCHSGVELHQGVLWLNPCLPEELRAVRSRIRYLGHWMVLDIRGDRMKVTFEKSWSEAPGARVGFQGEVYTFEPGDTREFPIS